jgi:DNA modification methylase
MLATCPEDGIVLDPFCGTGTTNLVALQLGRKSVGIDLAVEYIRMAGLRCNVAGGWATGRK